MVGEKADLANGTVVYDTVRGVVAIVMDVQGSRVYLRRPNGGVEWIRDRGAIREPTASESLSPRVGHENARSRGEIL